MTNGSNGDHGSGRDPTDDKRPNGDHSPEPEAPMTNGSNGKPKTFRSGDNASVAAERPDLTSNRRFWRLHTGFEAVAMSTDAVAGVRRARRSMRFPSIGDQDAFSFAVLSPP